MEDLLKDLLLQILLVSIPVFLFQLFLMKRKVSMDSLSLVWKPLSILCVMSIVLCMVFPVSTEGGFVFDLRIVPLVIAIAYGGMAAGLSTLVFMLVFHFFYVGEVFVITIINAILVIVFGFLFIYKYKHATRVTKISYYSALVYITSIIKVLGIMYLLLSHNQAVEDYLPLFIFFPLISVVTIWTSIHLVENMRERMMMEIEIQKAERLNVVGHLAASVAHEIRNPLTVVKGFMQLFRTDSLISDERKKHLNLMLQELDRAETIITDYLTLARPRVEKLEQIDVKKQIEFVKDIISSFAILNNGTIREDIEEELCVRGNPEKLNQVLINLIKNAIEASPEGAEVTITAYRKNDKITIHIIDKGIGMSQEDVDQLGTPFFSNKDNGTGLGLMVCYRIIEAMEGKIEVQSKAGEGTIFSITLPAQ